MKFVVINLLLPVGTDESELTIKIAKAIRLQPSEFSYTILKRSIDSRKGQVSFVYSAVVECGRYVSGRNVLAYKEPEAVLIPKSHLSDRPIVVGFGPAGFFAALVLARAGAKPIVLERGKPVEERSKDVELLKKKGILNPESNICYGEGGAGTFSDGKLNTGVNDPHSKFVLDEFVKHGAKPDILSDAMPHIGSDYLQQVVKRFREEILSLGGDILFQSAMTGLLLKGDHVEGVRYVDKDGNEKSHASREVFLALGHSPKDTMVELEKEGLRIEPKDFSIGVRLEHLQSEIDAANYHEAALKKGLPPSSYKSVVHLSSGRAVYSFCMCPGGYVVNSSSEENSVLTNGMSNNARDGKNGNAALLVNVTVKDYFHGHPLDGFFYREALERSGFCRDKPYFAPAERVGDFLKGNTANAFGKVAPSYEPGVYLSDLAKYLPPFIANSLKEGFPLLGEHQSFYQDPDAVMTGFETRSSSPVRIPRDERGEANIRGVYPLGEGASYAGGITSAALDGLKIALAVLSR
jgi:uncharacterized FAD-dependent dehydrogenase